MPTTANLYYGSTQIGNGTFTAQYLVIGGGGGASGNNASAGGGSGGYRCNVVGENSGGGLSAEPTLYLERDVAYSLQVGAGGAGGAAGGLGGNGSKSVFGPIVSLGGGLGDNGGALVGFGPGSGGRSAYYGEGAYGQNYRGGYNPSNGAGGGGGAGGVGQILTSNNGGNGGSGVTSSITGSAVARGGGGGGGSYVSVSTGGTATAGGGNGGTQSNGANATANTGGGGGGASWTTSSFTGGNGGSGLVVVKIPSTLTATFTGGVSQTNSTSGGFTTYVVTAAGLSDTVTFS